MSKLALSLSAISGVLFCFSCNSSKEPESGPSFTASGINNVKFATVPDYDIIRAQDGQFERVFMESQVQLFLRFDLVEGAYLVKAKHHGESKEVVMLVIAPFKAQSRELVACIREDLKRVAKGIPPLDITFADSESERKASAVAAPFFDRSKL